jgi:TRAP-type mannitol/chloroaromatic compound transport system permease small subunit
MVVLLRYVFGISSIAINESVLYLHATLFMLAAGYTLLVNGHVRVDIVYARLPQRGKNAVDLLGHLLLLIPSMLTILYWTWASVRSSWAIYEGPISVGGIPAVFLLKSLIPLFCGLIILQSLIEILRILSGATAQAASELH